MNSTTDARGALRDLFRFHFGQLTSGLSVGCHCYLQQWPLVPLWPSSAQSCFCRRSIARVSRIAL
jgi:hypothetical protein